MSILNDCEAQNITDFEGPNLIADEEDVSEPQALSARNCEYTEGQVRTRRGFMQVWNPNKLIQFLYSWVQQQFNRLIYFSATSSTTGDVISRDLSNGHEDIFLTGVIGQCMVCIQAGYRIIMSFFDDAGLGSSPVKIWDGTLSLSGPNVDNAFQPTLTTDQLLGGAMWGTFTEPFPGVVTVGTHQFALVPTTWNGFQTAPGPTLSGVFIPRPFTAAGGTQIQIDVYPSTTWPTWLKTLQIAMTTVDNPDRWFLVPDAIWFVDRGGTTRALFLINIDDVTLTGGGPTEITDTLFDLYTGATNCQSIIAYNNRVVYLTRTQGPDYSAGVPNLVSVMLISDPNDPQHVTPDQHVLSLPEFRDMVTGFGLGSSLYICGPSWTYAYTDNLRTPVLWSPPRRVSGDIGSPFIHGVSVNESRGYAWVCDHVGLFNFDGSTFPILPSSYEQTPDWSRINFNAHAHSLKVIEIPDDRLVIVRAPLDGAMHSTHLMVWDYTNGVAPHKIKYCGLWNLTDYPGIGDVAIVQAFASKVKQVWICRGDAPGDVKRRKTVEDGDAAVNNPIALYSDSGRGIDSAYKLLAVSRADQGVNQQVGGEFRIRGNGRININAYSFDQNRQTEMAPIMGSLVPGQRYLRLLDEQSECVSYEVTNGAVPNCFFSWSALRAYYLPWMKER